MRSLFNFDKRIFKSFSYLLMLELIPLFVISSYLIKEINPHLFTKQMIYYFLAAIVFFIAIIIPWRRILWWFAPLFFLVNIGLLVAVKYIGISIDGAQRWIAIPGVPFNIQPSEIAKIAVILMLAYLIARKPPKTNGYGIFAFIGLSIIIFIPSVFILFDPDLGTALMLVLTSFAILFIVGINWKIWLALLILMGAGAPLVYEYGLKSYQKKRILDAMEKPSYQVQQALIAIGSGGLEGQTKDNATQTQLKFLPVSSTDFIFAYLGERFGFKGMVLVICIYIFLILHLLWLSNHYVEDYYIKIAALGIAFLLFFHMTVNIFMIIGLAPVVGLPLPMFSHGGTSFILYAFIFGILQNLIAFKDYSRYNSDSKITMQTHNFH